MMIYDHNIWDLKLWNNRLSSHHCRKCIAEKLDGANIPKDSTLKSTNLGFMDTIHIDECGGY